MDRNVRILKVKGEGPVRVRPEWKNLHISTVACSNRFWRLPLGKLESLVRIASSCGRIDVSSFTVGPSCVEY